ncbi:30S ribosomal protein S20 [Ferrimicrobium acidiphilum]|uniref:Small ribosomal subunit protein bS20 n=1 Tax=Ferrimicrobium acidiphilum DSM 19497 TaxID=1121877 RepID=A0A0D8FS86_9ACTN|nr:30S ribosomal protein S20 [Ferrimicrobium acidiphilum]KJE75996.1 30S ribosomal protein S20 [Ferrimicrobium acidiphilum DSM 19497]MCL5052897.1 30S ribosomal protein S20 [Gammaproteobacteria bacterium]
MANIKSQIKRIGQNERRRERNKAVRSELKTRVKNAVTTEDEASVRLALKRLDKAASQGVIHKNQAARRKSRLMAQLARTKG